MRKALLVVLALLVIAGGGLVWRKVFPGAETRIRKQLAELAGAASLRGARKPMSQLADAGELAGFFTEDASIRVHTGGGVPRTIEGRASLQRMALGAVRSGTRVDVDFRDISVAVGPDGKRAWVELTAVARISGEGQPLVQMLRMKMARDGRKWLISEVTTVETFKRLQ